jgi:hypothetical protein
MEPRLTMMLIIINNNNNKNNRTKMYMGDYLGEYQQGRREKEKILRHEED